MEDDKLTVRYWRIFISLFIGVVLALQLTVIIFGIGARLYPFVTYGMYTRVHEDGEYLDIEYRIFAQLDSGTEIQIRPEDVGMNFWKLHRFANRILNGEDAEAQQLMSLYESRSGASVAQIRVATYPAIITRYGMQDAPSRTLRVIRRES